MNKEGKVKLFKNQILITGISVFALVVSLIGGSYAIFTSSSESGEYNVITVGDLDISYVDTGAGFGDVLSLKDAYPISDADGANQKAYRFSIENTGAIGIDFKIKVVNDDSIIASDGCSNNLIDPSYIKYKLDNDSPVLLSTRESSGYTIYTKSNLAGHAQEVHELRIWITNSASNLNNVLGKHFHGKVVVETSQTGIDDKLKNTYSVGNKVILKDGSSWHVLKDSSKTSSTVTLLSDYNLITEGANIGNYNTSCSEAACSPLAFDTANERNDAYCNEPANGCNMYIRNGGVVIKDSTIKNWLDTNYLPKIKTSLSNATGGTLEGLSVSLPTMEDIAKADGKTFNQTIFNENLSSAFLKGTNYWTKTASKTNSSYVWYVADNNINVQFASNNEQIGIRPVITTSKLNIETVIR